MNQYMLTPIGVALQGERNLAAAGGNDTFLASVGIRSIQYDPGDEPQKKAEFNKFLELLQVLKEKASGARTHAISYRNFRVGCAVLAVNPNTRKEKRRWRIFTGYNIKVAQDARPICAEQIAVHSAREAGHTKIIGIVVVGVPQAPEEDPRITDREQQSLGPCKECRRSLKETPGIETDTYIATFNPEDTEWEIYLFHELLALHNIEDIKELRSGLKMYGVLLRRVG